MKIALLADIHLGQKKFNRDEEKLSLINDIAKQFEFVFILGDLFYSKIASSRIRKQFVEVVLNNSGTIFYILGGNHDMTEDGYHPLSSESLLPSNIVLDDSLGGFISNDSPRIWLLHGYNLKERLPLLIKKVEQSSSKKNYLFSHFLMSGSRVGSGYQLSSDLKVDNLICFDKVILGDIHQQQTFYDKITYIGSLVRNDFNESSSGYFTYDTEEDLFNYVELEDRVDIIKLNESSSNIPDVKGHFIRFDIEGSLEFYNKMKIEINKASKDNEVYLNYTPISGVEKISLNSSENYVSNFMNDIKKKKLNNYLKELI